ncbi:YndJ family protein [Gracilibacillus sp. YIM 98692]|uniref:YndJ family protein n=1 Tax=Gracilibacillus sp. YIM 98692 TaxID=2663532 RepID=UPI0013D68CB6|nr:YndJ family protein [Gracilibacillus sp. YIM 98692]
MPQRLLQVIHSYIPIGLMIWVLTWLAPSYHFTERIILFAVFVVVPLTLFRVMLSFEYIKEHVRFIKLLIYLLPIGAFALLFSFAMHPGITAGLFSIPWSLVTFTVAIKGMALLKRSSTLSEVSKAIGFIYISISGIWLIAYQLSVPLLGFQGEIMLLTVNHFLYSGFVVPILFSYLYENVRSTLLSKTIVFIGTIAPIFIALGMTISPLLEWLFVVLYVGALLSYSVLVMMHIIPTVTSWTKVLHLVSSGIIGITMLLAMIYGYGEWTGNTTIPIQTMVLFHGWGNAILFSFLGVLAWHATIMDRETKSIPFSQIQAKGKIGSNIFSQTNVIDSFTQKPPKGLVDNLDDYKSKHLDPKQLHREIIDFYEHTEDYELLLSPHWSKPFALLAIFYKWISNRLEQMNFPLTAETSEQQVTSRILPIDDKKDGRDYVRAWVRTYTETNKAIYAALYSTHISNQIRYMNIAFPLPFSQMTSILFLEQGNDDSLSLTSWVKAPNQDQGVYLFIKQKAVRLPINETITVWKDLNKPNGQIEAKHDMWLFGIKFLTLDYSIKARTDIE